MKLLLDSSWLFVLLPLSLQDHRRSPLRVPEPVSVGLGPSSWGFWISVERVSGL